LITVSTATAVLDAMRRRLERGPHAALGVPPDADPAAARAAFMQLTKTYHPAKFARERPEIVRLANEVFLSLRAAYEAVTSGKAKPTVATVAAGTDAPPTRPTPAPPPIAAANANPIAKGTMRMARRDDSERMAIQQAAPPASPPAAATVAAKPVAQPASRDSTRLRAIEPRSPTPAQGVQQTPPRNAVRIATPPRRDSDKIIKQVAATAAAQNRETQKMGQLPATQATTAPIPAPTPSQPIPQLSEEAELEQAMELLKRRLWTEAKKAFHALAARDTVNKRYRALLSYARGREAQDEARHDIAREEFTRALQLDPDLNPARVALGQVAEEPKKPSGGLLSRLLKK
jgi:DnaJ-domain-containing protein 1